MSIAALALARPAVAHDANGYVFGVLPYQLPTRIGAAFGPVASDLGQALGDHVHLQTSNGFSPFVANLESGAFDIGLVDPVNAVRVVDSGAFDALARRPSSAAAIVVLPTAAVRDVGDLRGGKVGFPAAGSPVDVFVRNALDERGMRDGRDYDLERVSPGVCLHRLLIGKIEACATGGGASRQVFEREMGVALREILKTEPFPHMVFVVSTGLDARQRRALRERILGWERTEHGRELLAGIGADATFIPYVDADFDIVRQALAARQRLETASP